MCEGMKTGLRAAPSFPKDSWAWGLPLEGRTAGGSIEPVSRAAVTVGLRKNSAR